MDLSVKAGHDVLRERFRLADEYGHGSCGDALHPAGEYARAAVHLVAEGPLRRIIEEIAPASDVAAEAPRLSRRSALVRAAALLILEIERIDDQAPSIAVLEEDDEDLR
jgi:hypothetical protein